MNTNRKNGNAFESELREYLFRQGFWVYGCPLTASGQPCDIIAVKDAEAALIDCKVCQGNRFELSRLESNQLTSIQMFRNRTQFLGWFAIKIKGEVVVVNSSSLELAIEKGVSSLTLEALKEEWCAKTLEEWCGKW